MSRKLLMLLYDFQTLFSLHVSGAYSFIKLIRAQMIGWLVEGQKSNQSLFS